MSIFDLIVLIVLAISGAFGLYRGLIKLTVDFIAFILSIILAYFFHPIIDTFVSNYIFNESIRTIVSITSAYILCLIALTIITNRLMITMSHITGGIIDRLFGMLAGIIRGLVICLIVFLSIIIISSASYIDAQNIEELVSNIDQKKYPKWLSNSKTTKYLEHAKVLATKLIPDNIMKINISFDNTSKEEDILHQESPQDNETQQFNYNIEEIDTLKQKVQNALEIYDTEQ